MKKMFLCFIFAFCILFFDNNIFAADFHVNIDYDSDYVNSVLENNKEGLSVAHELADYYISHEQNYSIIVLPDKIYFILIDNFNGRQLGFNINYGSNSFVTTSISNLNNYGFVEIVNDSVLSKEDYISNLNTSLSSGWSNVNQIALILDYNFSSNVNLYNDFKDFDDVVLNIFYESNVNFRVEYSSRGIYPCFNNGDVQGENKKFLSYVDVMERYDTTTSEVVPIDDNTNNDISNISFKMYDMAKQLIGELPPQYEILYFIGTFIIFVGMIVLIISPIFIFRLIGGARR